jgi:YbbR domain-containing protein
MASVRQQTNRPVSSGVMSRAILAIVLAFGFWAWVTNNSDPDRSRDFPNISVTPINQPDGLAVSDPTPSSVTVTIWGPRSVVNSQTLTASFFAATIDLKDIRPGTQKVPIHVQTTVKNLRKKGTTPSDVQVTVERSIEKTLPVTVPMPSQPGVTVNSVTATPSDVRVSGPESKVNAVTQVAAAFDIGDRTSSFQTTVDVKALDASGREVAGVTLSPSRVTVATDLTDNRNERVVPVVTPDVTGAPAPGFRLDTINITPNQVTLTGNPQAIRTVPNVPTQPISTDGLNQPTTLTVQLDTSKLPSGVTIKNNVTSVQVQINIVEATQDIAFQVPIQPVNLRSGLQVSQLVPREATITLRGTRQQLDQISGTNVIAFANLASFTGPSPAKSVAVEVQLPTGSAVKVVKIDPAFVQVTVTAIPTPTPVPTATVAPTPTPRPPTSTPTP